MLLALSFLLLLAAGWVLRDYAECLDKDELPAQRRDLLAWIGKGILLPIVFWILLNAGLWTRWPALLPEIETAGPRRMSVLAGTLPTVLFFVSSWWTAITLLWLLFILRNQVQPEDRADINAATVGWSLLMLPLTAVFVYFAGYSALAIALIFWLLPLARSIIGASKTRAVPISYSRAVVNLKLGKYADAESEVIRQLEKRQDDFEGWMMLAELYATHFNDLPGARRTILDLCAQKEINASQLSVALHRLADWYLAAEDPARARWALEEISARFPGTHLERMALLRAQQLPSSVEELRARHNPKPIPLPRSEGPLR